MKHKMTLEAQLKALKQLIVAKYPDAQFESGIDWKDLNAFETTSGLTIPKELIAFYTWHNGVHIHHELYIPSLQEAYALFKKHRKNTIPQPNIKDLDLKTLEEVEKILSPLDKNGKDSVVYDEVWLPIYITHRQLHKRSVLTSYLLPKTGSLLKRHPVNEVGYYETSLDLSTSDENYWFILKSLPDIINALMEVINPPKQTFFRAIKNFINLVGQLFEGY